MTPRTYNAIALAFAVAGGFCTLGALLLDAPLFWIAAISAVVCAIVAVVAVLVGAAAASARASAHTHAREAVQQIDPVTGVWSSEPPLPNRIRGAMQLGDGGWPRGRLESLRFDKPITVGADWDSEPSDILAAMEAARRDMDAPLPDPLPLPEPGRTPQIPLTDYGRITMEVGGVTTARRRVEVQVMGRNMGKSALAQALGACTRDSGSSPAASAPDFTQEAHSEPQPPGFGPEYAVSGEMPGTIGHGAGVLADMMARSRKRQMPVDPVAEARQESRNAYWAERARVLLEEGGGGVPELFRETLEAAAAPGDMAAQALQLAQEIEAGDPSLPLLGFSERHPGAVTTDSAMAVIQRHRDHAGTRALLLAAMVKQQADEVSKLRGRMVGQIGMAAAWQRVAAEDEAEGTRLPLQQHMEEEGAAEVQRVLRELGWLVSLGDQSPDNRARFVWGWNGRS